MLRPPREFFGESGRRTQYGSRTLGERVPMATLENSPKHDLGSLRINEGQRKGRKTGKIFGIAAALIGVVVIVTGAVFAFRNRNPGGEVPVGKRPGGCGPLRQNAGVYVTPRGRATIAA